MERPDRARQEIGVAPTFDENGEEIIPRRRFRYDTLIIAVGSVGNDFGVPGVAEHCIMLDTPSEAREFHRRHINACLRAHTQTSEVKPGQLTVGIVGAGATGVELAAELHDTTRELSAYGLENIDPDKSLKLLIVEASDRILPGCRRVCRLRPPSGWPNWALKYTPTNGWLKCASDGMLTADGKFIPASMMVWSAGIKAPDFLKDIDGLETNRVNQLVVKSTLQTTRDDNIFALGDCAACPMPDGRNVPPRAQAAHQQASHMAKTICRRFRGKPLLEYVYRTTVRWSRWGVFPRSAT